MTEPEATDRLILDLREYGEKEDRGKAVYGSTPTKPIPLLALIAHIKRMAAIQGWRLMDAQEKRLGKGKRDEHGRFRKREE